MPKRFLSPALVCAVALLASCVCSAQDSTPLAVTVGKTLILDSPTDIVRVSVAGPAVAETVAINPREVLVNGLIPGETSLVTWDAGGARRIYNLTVRPSSSRLDAVRQQLALEMAGDPVTIDVENDNVYLRGNVRNTGAAARAAVIAGTLGKVVNLLYVATPPAPAQILLKVRFANVERSASSQLGLDIMTAGHISTEGTVSTGKFSLNDALDLLVFRKTFNLSATLTALQNSSLLEILAEPNLLAIDGQPASFLAGGEYPYPTVQSSSGATGSVTIAFREFGVRIKFLPTVTPRGAIRLHVAPEVSSLDFANGITIQGFRVPALVSRKVDTEVELESGQSFAIAGLLDNRLTDTLSKVPGLGNIPLLGKLFESRGKSKTNSELLVIITPELVRPIPAGDPVPELERPGDFLKDAPQTLPRTPGLDKTGPVPASSGTAAVPVERLIGGKEVLPTPGAPAMTEGPK